MDLYKLLPEFKGPNMFPPEKMAHFRSNIRPNMQFCGLSIVKRLTAWCEYIREYDLQMARNASKNASAVNTGTNSVNTSDPRSLAVSYDGCYDSYNCDTQELAGVMHSVCVAASLLVFLGLISNFYCLAKMYMAHNRPELARPPFGTCLICLIISDCLALLLSIPLFIIHSLAGQTHARQLEIYQSFTALIIPFLLPLYDLTRLLTTWLTVILLIQRSNTTIAKLQQEACGFPPILINDTKQKMSFTIKQLISVHFGLLLLCVPKFAEYTFNIHFQTRKVIIIPLLRVFRLYRMIMLKLVYPSIECVIPILLMLAYIAVIKYHEMILTRSRFQKITNDVDDVDDGGGGGDEEAHTDNCSRVLLAQNTIRSEDDENLTIVPFDQNQNFPTRHQNLTAPTTTAPTTCITLNTNTNTAIVFSVSGVSRRTQLVMWTSTALILALVIQLAAGIVVLERRLEGSPKEQWPRLRQGIKLLAIMAWLLVCAAKPIIYIHCCPRLLRKDLSPPTNNPYTAAAFICNNNSNNNKINNNNQKYLSSVPKTSSDNFAQPNSQTTQSQPTTNSYQGSESMENA